MPSSKPVILIASQRQAPCIYCKEKTSWRLGQVAHTGNGVYSAIMPALTIACCQVCAVKHFGEA